MLPIRFCRAYLAAGRWTGALQDAEAVLQHCPAHRSALAAKADSLYNLSQFERAMLAYQRGARQAPAECFRLGVRKELTPVMENYNSTLFENRIDEISKDRTAALLRTAVMLTVVCCKTETLLSAAGAGAPY